MAQIVLVDGDRMGAVLDLGSVTTLGRDVANSVVLEGAGVEPRHALINCRQGRYWLERADPRAAVSINGRDANGEALQHGDIVTLGSLTLLFSDGNGAMESDPEAPAPVVESRQRQPDNPGTVFESFLKTERLSAHLETLYRVSSTLAGTLKLGDVLRALTDIVFDVLSPDRTFILLCDEDGGLRVAEQRASETSQLRGSVNVSQTIINDALAKREGILTIDASGDRRFSGGESVVRQNIRSAMCAPIIKKERVLGVIHVDTLNAARRYTGFELQLLGGIAAQAAMAIENAVSHERAVERAAKLVDLSETSRRVSAFLSTEAILHEAVEGAARTFDAAKVSVLMFDGAAKVLRVAHAAHLAGALRESIAVAPGEGVAGQVFAQNVPRRGAHGGTPGRSYATTSYLVVPIVAHADAAEESRPVGVFCVTDRRSGRAFDEEDQELLSIFAAQIGTSLQNARFFQAATVDGLTGLFTRQYFFARLEQEVAKRRRPESPLAVIMLDLDHFKEKNDRFGHAGGDVILATAGRLVRTRLSEAGGLVGRYGGEEFVAMLPGRTKEEARALAEEVRAAIEAAECEHAGRAMAFTASLGVAQLAGGESSHDVVRRADAALYEAKRGGRNRVVARED